MASDKVILYPPQLREMGEALAKELGIAVSVCTDSIAQGPVAEGVVVWEAFPSASTELDPDIKVRAEALIDRHVVFLLSQDDTSSAFAQLSLLLWLQRFYVPRPAEEHAKTKWKSTIPAGDFDVKSVGSLTVVIPWYRYCQMDRSQRWSLTDAPKWSNGAANGPWIDVATAHTYAALLSAEPPPAPGVTENVVPEKPRKELLLIDIHDDLNGLPIVETVLRKTNQWVNPHVDYDIETGLGTYFASAFEHFLTHSFKPAAAGNPALTIVVFPDVGAYSRFHRMVERILEGIPRENVLFIEKKRVGTEISQSTSLNYFPAAGMQATRDELPSGSSILIPDDFTNSGSTLFGGATIVRSKVRGDANVSAFVSHFVAKYEAALVQKFVDRLYNSETKELDTFYTTDSVTVSVKELAKLSQARVDAGQSQRVFITPLAPMIASWLRNQSTFSPLGLH